MTDKQLSPAAQAVLDAYGRETGDIDCVWHPSELKGLAAALRAVVVQVAPVSTNARQMKIRDELLAIANELEGHEAPI
jgi:aminoglycoside phosphotransferase family enzyme